MNPSARLGAAIIVAAAFISPACEASENAEPVVFVGRLLQVRELPDECAGTCINFDSGYELEYEVVQDVAGHPKSDLVKIRFYGHYGLQDFAFYPHALLFVYEDDKQSVLARYLAFPVDRTTTGGWAYCGDPYREDALASDKKFRKVEYLERLEYSPVTKQYHEYSASLHAGEMRPGISDCRRGVYVADLAAYAIGKAEPGYNRVWVFKQEAAGEQTSAP